MYAECIASVWISTELCNGVGMAPPYMRRLESKMLIVVDHQDGVGTRTASLMFPEDGEGAVRVELQATVIPITRREALPLP